MSIELKDILVDIVIIITTFTDTIFIIPNNNITIKAAAKIINITTTTSSSLFKIHFYMQECVGWFDKHQCARELHQAPMSVLAWSL